jgi:hypothetical protein
MSRPPRRSEPLEYRRAGFVSRCECAFHGSRALPIATQIAEVRFVQTFRVSERQLAFSKGRDHQGRCVRVDLGELLLDPVEILDGAPVVVLVMRGDQLFGGRSGN